jgi:hypothetical protein
LLPAIPRSTRFDWTHKDIQGSFGYSWYQENKNLFLTLQLITLSEKLLKINRAFLRVIAINAFIKINSVGLHAGRKTAQLTATNNTSKVSRVIGLRKILKYLDIDFKRYLISMNNLFYPVSIYDLCLVKHPSQLLKEEIAIIKSYCVDGRFLRWPLISVYHQIKKNKAAYFSSGKFYKYVRLLKLERLKAVSRRKNHHIGLRDSKPIEIIHAGTTPLRLKDNTRAFIYLVFRIIFQGQYYRSGVLWNIGHSIVLKT